MILHTTEINKSSWKPCFCPNFILNKSSVIQTKNSWIDALRGRREWQRIVAKHSADLTLSDEEIKAMVQRKLTASPFRIVYGLIVL